MDQDAVLQLSSDQHRIPRSHFVLMINFSSFSWQHIQSFDHHDHCQFHQKEQIPLLQQQLNKLLLDWSYSSFEFSIEFQLFSIWNIS